MYILCMVLGQGELREEVGYPGALPAARARRGRRSSEGRARLAEADAVRGTKGSPRKGVGASVNMKV